MTLSEIVTKIRRGLQEPNPVYYQDSDIEDSVEDAIRTFALRIQSKAPAFFYKRTALFSLTHLFEWPTDCKHILKVWDLGCTAGQIIGASNEEPIVITQRSHGWVDEDVVTVAGVTGNTAANGTWLITYIDADNYSLVDSVGNGDWVASATGVLRDSAGALITDSSGLAQSAPYGGFAFKEPAIPTQIREKLLADADYGSPFRYYIRGRNIVVDDAEFSNDIVVDYEYVPSDVSDIPEEYQHGLVSWGISQLMVFDGKKDPEKKNQVRLHSQVVKDVLEDISRFTKSTAEPHKIGDVWVSKFNIKEI